MARKKRHNVKDARSSSESQTPNVKRSVAAAGAVVATGAWVKSKHDMYLIRGSVGA